MNARIIVGDSLTELRKMADKSARCVVTSPPYWGLRDYGNDGQMGLESTPQEYVASMVGVFREVRRVLADDGTLWLNLGDSYSGSGKGGQSDGKRSENWQPTYPKIPSANFGPKNLLGIPWRVAFALQDDGWILRQDIIWAKPNPMPESVKDRCTKSHEYLFLLSKSPRYYFDNEAIQEPSVYPDDNRKARAVVSQKRNPTELVAGVREGSATYATRNKRDVWTIPTQPFKGAHFAVMPEALVTPCVLAGSAEGDTMLDPFAGSGTVGVVALRHQRNFVGIELNPEYAKMARARIRDDAPMLNEVSE